MKHLLALFLLSTVVFASQQTAAPATLVLRNGKIVTVDAAMPEAQAIAIRGDRIAAVGTNESIQQYVGPSTQVIDLRGQLAIPGLIESHGHFMGFGQSKLTLDLMDVKDWNEIVVDGRGRGEAGEAGRVDPRPRLAPGKVEQRAEAERRRLSVSRCAEQGVAEQPGDAHARQRPRDLRQREGDGGREPDARRRSNPAAAKS